MKADKISVIMPSLNSGKTIEKSLRSVRGQNYPQDKIEILVIDGGSTDNTLRIAKKYKAKIIPNPEVVPEAAKSLGLRFAVGKYAVFLDSDEAIQNPNSFMDKILLLKNNPKCKNITSTGLISPESFPFITQYINRYGEPFSFFIYRFNGGDYFTSLSKQYSKEIVTENYRVFKFGTGEITPIVDGGGHFFDLSYLKTISDIGDKQLSAQVFSTMCSKTHRLAVLKDDFVIHYAKTNISSYLRKINWRIVSNISAESNIPGYKNREKFIPQILRYKKYLFLPYSLSLLLPLIDSLWLSFNHSDIRYLIHFPLTLYTATTIITQIIKRFFTHKSILAGEYK